MPSDCEMAIPQSAAQDAGEFNCVDLFAGAGGFSLAAWLAGLRVRFAVDNDRSAIRTYRKNFSKEETATEILESDITQIDASLVYATQFAQDEICDLMLGGPPCQGFSALRINDAGVGDKRNDLIHTYFDFVRAFAPSVFLMENVPGMLWDRHRDALKRFYKEGADAGYYLFEPAFVDARDFGVPQRRKRVFILGVRQEIDSSKLIWPPHPTHGNEEACKRNSLLKPWNSCKSVFDPAPDGDLNDIHMSHGAELIEAFRNTPPNGGSRNQSGRTLKCHQGHDGHTDVYGRIDSRKPAPTMTTACINPSKGRFVHPTEHHGITVRQAARIQTFPDSFVFEGGLMAAGRQIGNAVPVKLGRHLITHLKPLLRNGRNVRMQNFAVNGSGTALG